MNTGSPVRTKVARATQLVINQSKLNKARSDLKAKNTCYSDRRKEATILRYDRAYIPPSSLLESLPEESSACIGSGD